MRKWHFEIGTGHPMTRPVYVVVAASEAVARDIVARLFPGQAAVLFYRSRGVIAQ